MVQVVALGFHRGAQPIEAVPGAVPRRGGFEAVDQDLDGLEDLLGEGVGDVGLAAAALGQ